MPSDSIVYFDIAAVVIMVISLASLLFRGMTKSAASRVYLTAMVLITVTSIAAVGSEACDALVGSSLAFFAPIDYEVPLNARSALATLYYALRSLTAPTYLILIATVSDTSHKLDSSNTVRLLLWGPLVTMLLLAITNPLHHLLFFYENGIAVSGPLMIWLYIEAAYYSIIGIAWLIRWRMLLSVNEFATLMLLYPITLAVAAIQYEIPSMRLEMFVTSIAMMLVSAFVIHPETRHDEVVNAASLRSYQEMCQHAFITNKSLCLVYIEVVNLEQLRQLVGKIELQGIIRSVSENLASRLEHDDVLYYLQNGLFCISPRNIDPVHAENIAWTAHREGKARSIAAHEKMPMTQMRSCVIRIPEDISDPDTLSTFGRRFPHLVPFSTVTTYQKLSERNDFELQMKLASIVAKAIEERSFEVHYQPIYCLKDGQYHSAEALVRLRDDHFGWVSPGLFIPEAEQSGTIIEIGAILLEKICAFLGTVDFEAAGIEYVEVNLSVDQCIRPKMASELLTLLERNHVKPSRINVEITETSSAYSQRIIEDNAHQLANAGVSLSIDDYGTGYSNISRLLSLPFSLVKIDKAFVDGLDDPNTRTMLADTVASVKSIGKHVLVEGVETREQFEALRAMGVDYIQGYYFARPLPADEFIAFLKEQNFEFIEFLREDSPVR